jgi:hypothetical protein
MFKILIPAVACVALVAVSARTQTPDAASAAPAMAWRLAYEGPMAKLTYGAANSDQLAVMISCEPGQGDAVVYGEAHPDSPRLLQASAGPVAVDPLTGGAAYETRISLDDPSLTALASQGALRLVGDTGPVVLAADRADRRLVSDMLAYCGSSRA